MKRIGMYLCDCGIAVKSGKVHYCEKSRIDIPNKDDGCTLTQHKKIYSDIGICVCAKERLRRIEDVYKKYKHMGRIFGDPKTILFDAFERQIIYDLW